MRSDVEREHVAHFSVHDVLRQSEIRHGDAGNAAEHGRRFEHRDGMAHEAEEVRAGHARRAGADDRHLLSRIGQRRETGNDGSIGGKTFQRTDGNPFIILAAVAVHLAGMRAHSSGHAGERITGKKHGMSLFRLSVLDQGFNRLNPVARRAVRLAR